MNRAHLWDRLADIAGTAAPNLNKIAGLFAANRLVGTLLLWLTSLSSLLLVYLLVSWIPTIAQQTGRGANVGMLAAAVLNVTGIVGSVCFGRLSDRWGAFGVVSSAYVGGACLVLAVGLGTDLTESIYWVAGLAGFFCIGAQLCLVSIASGYYPLEMRATGVGWSMGVGRVGAIAGPLVGALLIHSSGSQHLLFIVLAVTSLVSGLAIFVMGATGHRGSLT
jgi:AAHS family 4-hydroxybenzoate transporter-like MFS transporter